MRSKAQRFDPRQDMQGENFEIFHYLDMKTRHMESHYHDFYEIFCFIEGDVDYWIEGIVYHLKPGDILLINPNELHRPIPKSETEKYERIVLWVNKEYLQNINNNQLSACFDTSLNTYKKIIRPTNAQNSEIIALFSSLIREYYSDDFAKELSSYGIFLQIMSFINRVSLKSSTAVSLNYQTPTLITDVIAYISEHYNEDLSLEKIAKHFFVSKYHLSHEFSKTVGTSVYRYITLKRLNIAHDMLKQGISPGQVSVNCGFGDYTNFFRAFKAEFGINPRECR